jgi:hypothetical protein
VGPEPIRTPRECGNFILARRFHGTLGQDHDLIAIIGNDIDLPVEPGRSQMNCVEAESMQQSRNPDLEAIRSFVSFLIGGRTNVQLVREARQVGIEGIVKRLS